MRIALLAYYFPPDQSVGSIRPENWAKWLGEGYDITVVAPRFGEYRGYEDKISYRVVRPRSILLVCLELFNSFRKKIRKRGQVSTSARKPKVKTKSTGVLIYRMPCLHDLWLFSSYRAIKTINPDVVIATHGPYINIVTGFLYVLFNKKTTLWIDYRDLWTMNHAATGVPVVRVLEKLLEEKVINAAQVVTSVSYNLCKEIANNFGKHAQLVYNAPVSSIVQDNRPVSRSVVTICYAGTIYPVWRDPTELFMRIRNMVNSNELSAERLQIIFASRNAGDFFTLVDEFSVRQFIDYRGAVSREESLAMQQEADILLLLESHAPEARGVLTGKVFEYLMTDKPILLVGPGPDSELYQLLQKHDRLFTLDDLERFLRGQMERLPKGKPVDYSEISRSQLLAIMDGLAAKVGSGVKNA
jgi:glycosyltransferase involved in cell wall biosynthesis